MQLLGRVGIPRAHEIIDEYPHQLSGGMRQRVMIAIALACDPILLIADEPTTALDVTIQAQILRLLQELQQDYGMSILFISHDLGVIAEMADRVFVMYMGRIVESALVEELFRNPKHPYTVALLKSIPGAQKTVKTKLDSIHGSIPSPFAVLKGCSFFARCTQRMKEICESAPPDEYLVGENHSVACYHYKEGVN